VWREVVVTIAPGRDRYLGAGSFGEVLRAFLSDGTEVAVKLAKEGRHVADLDEELESFKKLAGESLGGVRGVGCGVSLSVGCGCGMWGVGCGVWGGA
jgi:hypothetical protein